MWKKLLDEVLASCVYADPMVYMYWLTAQREAEEAQAERVARPSPSRAAGVRRLEIAHGSREATA